MTLSHDVVAVAAYGLAGSRVDLPSGRMSRESWSDVILACASRELLGFLSDAVSRGGLEVTDEQRDELDVLEAESAGLTLALEHRVVRIAGSLRAAGVDYRVADGPARARVIGADPDRRHYETVDLIVEPGHGRLAASLQGSANSQNGMHRVRRRARIAIRTTLLPAGDYGAILDLTDLADPPPMFEIGGESLPALSPEEQLVCAAVEAVHGHSSRRLPLLRDVAELVLAPAIDARRVRSLATTLQVENVVSASISQAWRTFDLADKTVLSVWADRQEHTVAATTVPLRQAQTTTRRRRPLTHKVRRLVRRWPPRPQRPAPTGRKR